MRVEDKSNQTQNLDQAWEQSGGDSLMNGRSYQYVFDLLPLSAYETAVAEFAPQELVAVCMDDRNPDDGIYSGGGLILLDQDEAVSQIKHLGVTATKSHPNCGAGAVLAARLGLPASEGDRVAVEQSKKLAQAAGITYAGASLVDSATPHKARAALVFLDTAVRHSALKEFLPPAFYLSGNSYPAKESLLSEVLLTPQIAMNEDHAFGKYFTKDVPFDVVFLAQSRRLAQEYVDAFKQTMQSGLPDTISSRVAVQSVQLRG